MQRTCLLLAALAAAVSAQNYTVSPSAFTTTSGNSGNTIPFWSATHHYMQLHGDLRGGPLVIRELSLRRWNGSANTTAVARTIDLEGHMGPCNATTPSSTFASNYTATPTNVYLRKMTNLPDWVANQGSPAPWSLIVPSDTPYVHIGVTDLAWEWRIHGTTSAGAYYADVYSGSSVTGTNVVSGTGCVATGRVTAMAISNSTTFNASTDSYSLAWTVSNAAASAPTAFLLGIANPNAPIPGFCTNLYSTGNVLLTSTASAAGTATLPTIMVPYNPALVGGKLHAQGVCVDTGRTSGLQVSGSNAVETTIPARPALLRRIWADDVNAVTGSLSESYPYGLITRFTHQ